ncbi:MAG: Rrf2 family transcriptional regulator [Candidatus Brocadiia bacterium]|jgi:Rrf2 family protein|nr:Rrf2 family transcriptional regulator [Candidatus Brocadiia bacterium]
MEDWGRKAEYAVSAAADMAANYAPERPLRVEDIARRTGAPPNYLRELLARLRTVGLVASRQGPGGGYWLVRPPDRISVAEILSALAAEDGRRSGRFSIEAPYRGVLDWLSGEVAATRRAFLRGVTLADVAGRLVGP